MCQAWNWRLTCPRGVKGKTVANGLVKGARRTVALDMLADVMQLLKVDAEGTEALVLEGASKLFARHIVQHVVAESFGWGRKAPTEYRQDRCRLRLLSQMPA
jgi:hypothetical protein